MSSQQENFLASDLDGHSYGGHLRLAKFDHLTVCHWEPAKKRDAEVVLAWFTDHLSIIGPERFQGFHPSFIYLHEEDDIGIGALKELQHQVAAFVFGVDVNGGQSQSCAMLWPCLFCRPEQRQNEHRVDCGSDTTNYRHSPTSLQRPDRGNRAEGKRQMQAKVRAEFKQPPPPSKESRDCSEAEEKAGNFD